MPAGSGFAVGDCGAPDPSRVVSGFPRLSRNRVSDPDIFRRYVFEVARSLVRAGARRIVFLNTGIARATGLPIAIAAREIRVQTGTPTLEGSREPGGRAIFRSRRNSWSGFDAGGAAWPIPRSTGVAGSRVASGGACAASAAKACACARSSRPEPFRRATVRGG